MQPLSNKKRKVQEAVDLIAALADLFPAAFVLYEQRRRPIKIGIRDDILAAANGAITEPELHLALRHYCGNSHYLLACREGAERIDLHGAPAGHVTADEAKHATATLAARRRQPAKRPSTTAGAPPRRIGLADLKRTALARKAAAP